MQVQAEYYGTSKARHSYNCLSFMHLCVFEGCIHLNCFDCRRLMRVVDRYLLPSLGLSQPLTPLVDEFAGRLFTELDYVLVRGGMRNQLTHRVVQLRCCEQAT